MRVWPTEKLMAAFRVFLSEFLYDGIHIHRPKIFTTTRTYGQLIRFDFTVDEAWTVPSARVAPTTILSPSIEVQEPKASGLVLSGATSTATSPQLSGPPALREGECVVSNTF